MLVKLATLTAIGLSSGVLLWDHLQLAPSQALVASAPQLDPEEIEISVLAPPANSPDTLSKPPAPKPAAPPSTVLAPALALALADTASTFKLAGASEAEPDAAPAPAPDDALLNVTPTAMPADPVAELSVPPMRLFVTRDRVNLRAGPSTEFRVLTRLHQGDSVVLLGDPGGGWLEIRDIRGDARGFMAIDYLSPEDPR